MCKKYPGLRCGNAIHEKLASIINQLEEAKAFRDVLDPSETKSSDLTDANRRVTVLEARVKAALAKYDSTDSGFAALEAEAQDESLTNAERTVIKVRLKDAAKDRDERAKVVSDAEARKANVVAYLQSVGVPANECADFSDTNIYTPASGSAKHYETIKNNRMKAYEARRAEYNRALAKAKTPAEKAKADEREGLAVEKAKSDYNRALYVYDSTAAGIEALNQKLAKAAVCYTAKDVATRTRLELRLANAKKAHRTNLDSRNYRTAKLAQLKAVVEAHGGAGAVGGAVEAFKNKNPLPKRRKSRIPLHEVRTGRVQTHLTEGDLAAVDSTFRQSDEYKTGGEDARARFIERRVLTAPHEIYLRESLDDANARVVIASNGKTGRNTTVIDLEQGRGIPRSQTLVPKLTERDTSIVKARAEFLNMSVSSYVRAMLIGENPVAHENDRSAATRAKKHANASRILRNRLVAA